MKSLLIQIIIIVGVCFLPLKANAADTMLSDPLANVSAKSAKSTSTTHSLRTTKRRQELKVSSRKQAAALVKARYKAKVLSVNSSKVNGNPGYRVKLLGENGTVFYVLVDAKTGQIRRS